MSNFKELFFCKIENNQIEFIETINFDHNALMDCLLLEVEEDYSNLQPGFNFEKKEHFKAPQKYHSYFPSKMTIDGEKYPCPLIVNNFILYKLSVKRFNFYTHYEIHGKIVEPKSIQVKDCFLRLSEGYSRRIDSIFKFINVTLLNINNYLDQGNKLDDLNLNAESLVKDEMKLEDLFFIINTLKISFEDYHVLKIGRDDINKCNVHIRFHSIHKNELYILNLLNDNVQFLSDNNLDDFNFYADEEEFNEFNEKADSASTFFQSSELEYKVKDMLKLAVLPKYSALSHFNDQLKIR